MNIGRISGALPDTATTNKHPRSISMRTLLDGIAKQHDGAIEQFSVEDGVATVRASDEKILDMIKSEFEKISDVQVTIISAIQAEIEANRRQQEKIDSKRKTKKEKKQKVGEAH